MSAMTIPLLCLLGFVVWTALLVLVGIAVPRITATLRGKAPPTGFLADVPHGSERYRRTMRAHINCVENLPMFAAVVLTGAVVHAGSPLMDTLALTYMAARVAHTLIHVASGAFPTLVIRLLFFATQMVVLMWMVLLVYRTIAAGSLA
jgi:uncharacterized MAPEG superfamily protein